MPYDEGLVDRIRDLVADVDGVTERTMFGGLGFMVHGHLAVAASSSGDLMVRADPAAGADWVDGGTVRPMEMRGRPMHGWLVVSIDAVADDAALRTWVDRGVGHVQTLPPK